MNNLITARSGALFAAAIAGALLSAAAPALAVTYSVVYSFQGGGDGESPYNSLFSLGGKLYGTTRYGGGAAVCGDPYCGTVYSITTAGVEQIVYSFCSKTNCTDGAYPYSGLINSNGTLYGTTSNGGATANGTVFSITPAGSENVVYSFAGGSLGADPEESPNDVSGTLYGTTYGGGSGSCFDGCGTAYSVTTAGVWNWVYDFQSNGSDGYGPSSKLYKVGGKLYGTTGGGGASDNGTVFSITTTGTENVLYSFKGGSDGALPSGGLVDVGGTLYGTTQFGGGAARCGANGCGTVYSITTAGVEKVLHTFKRSSDGDNPASGLIDVGGTLYGTTFDGGNSSLCQLGCGTVYSISTAGVEKVLYSFKGGSDGEYPDDTLINVSGTLWGTTVGGGTGTCPGDPYGCGTVFKLKP